MLSLIFATLFAAVFAVCPATEREALVEIYDATNGPAWKTNNWLSNDVLYCSWTGVVCNNAGYVTELNLVDLGLNGALPEAVGCFPYLKTLYLSNNTLVGAIPPEICDLTNLQYLQIDNAGLTGEIPTCMCTMVHLMYWYMSSNTITGEIPSCIGEMTYLRELHLDCNQLTGSVPAGLFDLQFLTEVRLQCNAGLTCTTPPASYTGIYQCGTDGFDCSACDSLIPTNCPEQVEVDGCTYYRQTTTRLAKAKGVKGTKGSCGAKKTAKSAMKKLLSKK